MVNNTPLWQVTDLMWRCNLSLHIWQPFSCQDQPLCVVCIKCVCVVCVCVHKCKQDQCMQTHTYFHTQIYTLIHIHHFDTVIYAESPIVIFFGTYEYIYTHPHTEKRHTHTHTNRRCACCIFVCTQLCKAIYVNKTLMTC